MTMERRRGGGVCGANKLTGVGIEVGLVEVLDNLLDGRDSPVPGSRVKETRSAKIHDRRSGEGRGAGPDGCPGKQGANDSHLEVAAHEELACHCDGCGMCLVGWSGERVAKVSRADEVEVIRGREEKVEQGTRLNGRMDILVW